MKRVLALLIFFSLKIYSQENPIYVVEGDTLKNQFIPLKEVVVIPELKFYSYKDYVDYYNLKRKTIKVYPYARLASERLLKLNDRLNGIKSKRGKRKYTKRVEKFLEQEFKEELKKLTRSEGRILIKLIHRETGSTAYSLVKTLRTGWKAFIYQTTAKMFEIDLKKEYNPSNNSEDYKIENIVLREFANSSFNKN